MMRRWLAYRNGEIVAEGLYYEHDLNWQRRAQEAVERLGLGVADTLVITEDANDPAELFRGSSLEPRIEALEKKVERANDVYFQLVSIAQSLAVIAANMAGGVSNMRVARTGEDDGLHDKTDD